MLDIRLLGPDEWPTLRDVRLSALRDSPHSFLSQHDLEDAYDQTRWRAEFTRGDWYVGIREGEAISLLAVTRERGTPRHQCYLEFLWVSPECRRSSVATRMLQTILERLKKDGIRTAFLWVLDGNDTAVRLYEKIGFAKTNFIQPIPDLPERTEERMRIELDDWWPEKTQE